VNPLPSPGLSALSVLTICPNDLAKAYIAQSAPGFDNSTFNWTITGGTPTTATDQKLLGVDWGNSGNYQLILRETSAQGCSKDSILPLQFDPSALQISRVSLLEEDETKVEIRFRMDNKETNPSTISLWRQEEGSNNWIELQTALPKESTSYVDEPGNTDSRIWKYRINGTNLCSRPIVSEVHNTMVLKGFASDADESSNLSWNAYNGWASAPVYRILRGFDENSLSEYESGITASAQPSVKFKNAPDAFVQWYRVVAEGPDGEIAYSSKLKLDFQNKLGFYNLITPNGDGANEGFFIKNLDLYPENELVITNRWGIEVFRKKDYRNADGWKGSDVEDGVYYYKFTAATGNFSTQGWVEIKRQ
jgi:gliding motility-associated-like protein